MESVRPESASDGGESASSRAVEEYFLTHYHLPVGISHVVNRFLVSYSAGDFDDAHFHPAILEILTSALILSVMA